MATVEFGLTRRILTTAGIANNGETRKQKQRCQDSRVLDLEAAAVPPPRNRSRRREALTLQIRREGVSESAELPAPGATGSALSHRPGDDSSSGPLASREPAGEHLQQLAGRVALRDGEWGGRASAVPSRTLNVTEVWQSGAFNADPQSLASASSLELGRPSRRAYRTVPSISIDRTASVTAANGPTRPTCGR